MTTTTSNPEPNDVDLPPQSVHSTSLPALLRELGISLAISTYQAGKLILARAGEDGLLNTHFRDFRVPMGLAAERHRLAIGTANAIQEFRNQPEVAGKLEPVGKHDGCFMPSHSHTTGDIRVHELAWAGPDLWIVNTRFSCLCTLDRMHSFVPRWRPPFITALAPEDRCHLNGLAVVDGRPKFVTCLGTTDTANGWRENKAAGGCLIDIQTDDVLASGLSMPHSPRWYGGHLWVLESGAGTLAIVDRRTGKWRRVAELPGFTRGLDFCGPYAFIGLSQVRETAVFSGIPITETAQERVAGVWVVDVRTGQTVALLRFEARVREIFAVQVLHGLRYPELLTEGPMVDNSFVLPPEAPVSAGSSTRFPQRPHAKPVSGSASN